MRPTCVYVWISINNETAFLCRDPVIIIMIGFRLLQTGFIDGKSATYQPPTSGWRRAKRFGCGWDFRRGEGPDPSNRCFCWCRRCNGPNHDNRTTNFITIHIACTVNIQSLLSLMEMIIILLNVILQFNNCTTAYLCDRMMLVAIREQNAHHVILVVQERDTSFKK